MPWADIAFSGCLGSSKYVFIGHAVHSQGLERRCPPATLFSGAARQPRKAGTAPDLLSLNSSHVSAHSPDLGWLA